MDDNLKKLLEDVTKNHERNTMVTAGKAMHDLFVSFVEGGFTVDQSLKLVSNIVVGAIFGQKQGEGK